MIPAGPYSGAQQRHEPDVLVQYINHRAATGKVKFFSMNRNNKYYKCKLFWLNYYINDYKRPS